MGKLIEISQFKRVHHEPKKSNKKASDVIGFEEAKIKLLEKERREAQRTILTEFVSAYAVLPQRGLLKVDLFNISGSGLAFDVTSSQGQFNVGEELALRIYLNHKTYFPFTVKVRYANDVAEESVIRHGAEFTESAQQDVALQHFVRFIETVSSSLKEDEGDLLIPNIS